MNLHKTLKAYNEAKPNIEEQLLLSEAKNILNNADKKDINALSFLGMDKNLDIYNKKQQEKAQTDSFEEVYDISVIKKMAIDYGLRFLPSNYYRGTIDPLMPAAVNSFVEKHKIIVQAVNPATLGSKWGYNGSEAGKQFFILAPAESFALEERPKDPIIFYKINENKYAFIYKWGNDLSSRRKVANFFFRTTGHFLLSYALFIISMSLFLTYATGNKECLLMLGLLFLCLPISMEYEGNSDKWDSKYL